MKNLITLATLLQLGMANASIVAIMDSGTDISHKDLAPLTWTNQKEKEGSKIDMDGSGLAGDVHGWDFTENSAKVFNDKYNYLVTEEVKKFFTLYAKYETKTINQTEFEWLKNAIENKKFMNQVDFVGGYAHGTHVGGIATINNPKAEVMSLKIISTTFKELPADKNETDLKTKVFFERDGMNSDLSFLNAMTFDQYKEQILKDAASQVEELTAIHSYLNFYKTDVVNQSFGLSFAAVAKSLEEGFLENVKRKPSENELVKLLAAYFSTLKVLGPRIFSAAPDTVFVIAAGNDTSDNDAIPDFPAGIQAPNRIVVAATLGYSELADFSNFGATKVDVAAPGVAIKSAAPTQSYVYMSGTSQATPFVTNAISMAKDINPALSVVDLKSIILKTVDVKAWLKGKVATSGIVNKARVLRAAELSKSMNTELAIQKARIEIADVATPKAFNKRLPGMQLNYKPKMPSLSIKF